MCILEVMKYDNSLFVLGSQFDFFIETDIFNFNDYWLNNSIKMETKINFQRRTQEH